MTRVKRGLTSHQKHKKVLELAKGYRMTKSRLYKVANEAVLHAGEYAFAGRKHRKRQMRRLWITRINAALTPFEIKYSEFIHLLKIKNIQLDRKILALIAQDGPFFERLVKKIK
ncbi:50S ribosomal protein L20 [Candidatus Roizmanbacteria bacterium RIFOXYB2_FULL_41_10]|uniref:Large ribosomal subunit protein bL20 n=1 Tax=Candidatus Roizmanbacteria bacterium RIFOXYA1_FULL_41_12 TaxID=1802082 RepID=A0A1F7KEQ0_9BACT|nr:MAG: 50S ribosomal protein L20 [Candidatus Roizmanbacteria bacterium RIFOXYA1_FULL_41_12]OGK67129.1 MAG: 50S ribosomal protein L20 [Candidatus Roizmanbacteria bacterium RIFOXYB1_FULL_41_27]OGK68468.1 MAG: 50S ribosomal protein L20 [Candidatus Roizmanbacteria bacterium RIFOXYA2_FULL_41_8]OGK69011.1 MAG: 50S ribosomal protein L20 [Candidatus Roizmanbacteria bacterium RIFOXYB2_FULL_41_10]OGK71533.1 MAG: 50S ribosomal protein L20 [Candidatus Roizmanbacteria bacterium RIFOXYC1_FULL_41_16]OGK7317